MKTILITGGTGFIGQFLVREFLTDHKIICLIRPNTKNLDRLEDVKDQIKFIEHDIRQDYSDLVDQLKDVSVILHAGANPSSQASTYDPVSVVLDNVLGTTLLLELARKLPIERFVYYSAAEVFGPIEKGTDSGEDDRYNSNSPYSASKAGGEELCLAYSNTFNIPVSVVHITNTFGQRCQAARFPTITIKKLLNKEPITLHVGPDGSIGGRRWFHAINVALHTRFILTNQKTLCEKWNSAGEQFVSNLDFAQMVADILDQPLECNYIPIDRPGHDLYYSVSPSKILNAGWVDPLSMIERLKETVEWYKDNPAWLTRE